MKTMFPEGNAAHCTAKAAEFAGLSQFELFRWPVSVAERLSYIGESLRDSLNSTLTTARAAAELRAANTAGRR